MTSLYVVGDVFDRLAELRRRRVRAALVLCSPPFLALRSYLPDGHPLKAQEIGSEATPAAFVDVMLALVAACAHVLAPWGSVALELGDTYAGSGGAGGDYPEGGMRAGQPTFPGSAKVRRTADDYPIRDDNPRPSRSGRTSADGNGKVFRGGQRQDDKQGTGWPEDKSLAGIPQAVMLSLAYGYNVLDRRGPDSPAGRWRVRNLKPWIRSNPPIGALGDKERPATSYVIVATRDPQRYFDLDSARTKTAGTARRAVTGVADAHVVPTAFHAGSQPALRGWCDPGQSKVTIGPTVTWQAQRLEVVEPVGFLVGVEQVEGSKMMDLESASRPADLAAVPIAVERLLAGGVPVASSVAGAPALPSGVVLSSEMDAPPLTGTFEAAEVVCQDLALVADQWLAARITLHLDGASRTAFAIAPVAGAGHGGKSNSKYPASMSAGAPPRDWCHSVDMVLDAELDRMAGTTTARAGSVPKGRNGAGHAGSDRRHEGGRIEGGHTVGARGVHLRRALERAGILITIDALDVSPKGYKGAHYAVWPPDLVRLLVDEMCPRRVCSACGQPSRRIVDVSYEAHGDAATQNAEHKASADYPGQQRTQNAQGMAHGRATKRSETLGWSDCGCPGADRWQSGLVLDPFAGSGTTLAVCSGMGRESIGIDLDYTNVALAADRVGVFLDVEWPDPDWDLLATRALGAGSPHPASYDRWAPMLGDRGRARCVALPVDEPQCAPRARATDPGPAPAPATARPRRAPAPVAGQLDLLGT